ncbi:aldo/keto reductase [Kutzneria buriramensis]|uniref:Aryl-alcohol dehydrogenase-like predicted oxidoreductase n=1 Tax=Kutzneria buriramensis TaxID=1045776 RepID=A0A3E0GYW9_9PSEU|nr:aldo/keto reductase [Kutzneria buriramensis]REH32996.1 aryl-alcohol dehydrogenase-like predicted oxidoreductase [Kutzneria buriramensis]
MRYATVGEAGPLVPAVILGCGNFGGIGSPKEFLGKGDNRETAFEVMDAARESGVSMFDTADAYAGGLSEQWIGEWLASRNARDDVQITTKVGGPADGGRGLSRDHIRRQIAHSLKRLGVERVALYITHTTDDSVPIEETVGAFEELVAEGKIGAYGMSNFDAPGLAAALAVGRPVNVQNGYNLFDRRWASDMLALASSERVGFTAYSPLAGGLLTGKHRGGEPPAPGSRMALRPPELTDLTIERAFEVLPRLIELADAHGVSLTTLALAWVLTDPGVTAAVVGPRSAEHLKPMLAAVDLELTTAQRAELTAVVDG